MSTAPRFYIDLAAFWRDPYPTLARLRAEVPIAFVPQLGSTLFTRRDDIFVSEQIIDVFSSHQPAGLMTVDVGHCRRSEGEPTFTQWWIRHRSLVSSGSRSPGAPMALARSL